MGTNHRDMARIRANRRRMQEGQASDPLSTREAGWVLRMQTARQQAKAKAELMRQRRRVASAFMPYYTQAGFRQAVVSNWVDGSGHQTYVYVDDHHGEMPRAHTTADTVWDSKGKCRSGTFSAHQFWLPRTWSKRVAAKGLALIDGMLTLDARRIPRAKTPFALSDAYEATWCQQSKGTSLVTECGAIVRLSASHPWVHGPTVDAAARAAQRRVTTNRRAGRQEARSQAIANAQWSVVWPDQDFADIQVCMRDSESVGNCDSGTRAWVQANLPTYAGKDCAPASVVLAAAAKDPTGTRRLAVAAVHRAILRSRKAA